MSSPFVSPSRGLVDTRRQEGGVFDQVAELYDAARPGYPAQALADMQARCAVGAASRVLEIGCGTGQATRALAATGAAIDCLEPGPSLAALTRKNLTPFPNARVSTSRFEDLTSPTGHYDVIVSATAFHWTDPNVSFAKTARLLRPSGSFALMTNAHASGGTQAQIASPIAEIHRRLAPEIGPWSYRSAEEILTRAQGGGDIAAVWSRVERKLGEPPSVAHLFEPPVVSTYPWLANYSRDGYLDMLATQSSYALMEPNRRGRLLDAIGRVVDDHLGGLVTKQYVTVLATAGKPSV